MHSSTSDAQDSIGMASKLMEYRSKGKAPFKDLDWSVEVSLVQLFRQERRSALVGTVARDPWAIMRCMHNAMPAMQANVCLEICQGTAMNKHFLLFRAVGDLELFQCELVWNANQAVEGTSAGAMLGALGVTQSEGSFNG